MFSWIEKHPVFVFLGIVGLYGAYWLVIPRCFDEHPATVSNVPKVECSAGEGAPLADVTPTGRTKGLIPWDKSGVFGDSFGALTCLFSALTFWAMLYALMYQRHQTRDAREGIAKEHLPLVLLRITGGVLRFEFSNDERLSAEIEITADEENVSDYAALALRHKGRVELFDGHVLTEQPLNVSDYLKANDTFKRNESFRTLSFSSLEPFLSGITSVDQERRPKVFLDRMYRSFLEAYGYVGQNYLIRCEDTNELNRAREVLGMIRRKETITRVRFNELFNGAHQIHLGFDVVHSDGMAKCISKREYDQFTAMS